MEEDLGGEASSLPLLSSSTACLASERWRRRPERAMPGASCIWPHHTHLALDRSPLIFGISASAALPVAARGGLHGGVIFVSCVHSLFCSMCAGRGGVCHKAHPGPTRACRGSPESSPQCENVCGLVLRPRHSRSRETRWGATKTIHRGG